MGRQLVWLALFWAFVGVARAEQVVLPPDLWDKPRSGEAMLAQPALKHCVETLLADPRARLSIHYGKGDETMLQATELRAWLVALAADGARIDIVGDGDEGLNLELTGGTVEDNPPETKRNP